MNRRKLAIYFAAPLAVTVPLILMYFSGNTTLQHIVSPEFDGIYWHSNREFGFLENLQHLILLAMLVVVLRGLFAVQGWARAAVALLAVFTAFILLEELDWGRHYYEFFTGVTGDEALQQRNWHNVGSRTELTKLAVDIFMVGFFLIAPIVLAGSAFRIVRLFTPDLYAAWALAAMVVARGLIHFLQEGGYGTPGTLDRDLNEFREILTYYLFATYLFNVFERRLRGRPDLGEEAGRAAISPPTRTAPARPQEST